MNWQIKFYDMQYPGLTSYQCAALVNQLKYEKKYCTESVEAPTAQDAIVMFKQNNPTSLLIEISWINPATK